MKNSPAPRIVVRVGKIGYDKGILFGIYADSNDAVAYRGDHFTPDDKWYLRNTRPATAEEEQAFTAWFDDRYSMAHEGISPIVKRRTVRH